MTSILTKQAAAHCDQANVDPPTIACSRNYRDTSGMPFDHDRGMPAEELLSGMKEIWPEIESKSYIIRSSASSNIYHKTSGEPLRGQSGLQLIVIVSDGADISRAGDVLNGRAWLHGYHNSRCADPLAPKYCNDRRIWIIQRGVGRPYIFSQAHGGRRFTLVRARLTIRLLAGERYFISNRRWSCHGSRARPAGAATSLFRRPMTQKFCRYRSTLCNWLRTALSGLRNLTIELATLCPPLAPSKSARAGRQQKPSESFALSACGATPLGTTARQPIAWCILSGLEAIRIWLAKVGEAFQNMGLSWF